MAQGVWSSKTSQLFCSWAYRLHAAVGRDPLGCHILLETKGVDLLVPVRASAEAVCHGFPSRQAAVELRWIKGQAFRALPTAHEPI